MKTSVRNLVLLFIPLFLVILVLQSCSGNSDSVTPAETSFEMKVTFSPIEVKSTDGKINLLYSVEMPNFENDGYQLKDFQVLNAANGNMLCSISDTGRYMLIHKPFVGTIPPELINYPQIDIHSSYRVSIGLVLDPAQVPQRIKHKLVLLKNSNEKIIEGAESSVSKEQPAVISAPLKGERFVSALTTTLINNHHPQYQMTYHGITKVPERFCVDWNQVDATGSPFHGDKSMCGNYYIYGQNVYAVANGQVVSVSDGMPDQSPVGTKSNDLNLFNSTGNSINIFIGGGYVTYAHLQPNSIVVTTGQLVNKGDLIGKVGNSGNSDAPHLHFGLHTDFPYYISESIPYYIDSLEKIGTVDSKNFAADWLPNPELHTNELVENFGVYNFK